MLQAGVLKPVHEATCQINNFVLVESKDNLGSLKLCICFDPTNLNKAITREPYHFRMPEDIAHLLAGGFIMTVCDCKKGYWHQMFDEASLFLTTFNIVIDRFRYIVMPFGATVAKDVFQHKVDQRGTLSPQLNWICKEQCNFLAIRLEITCFYHLHIYYIVATQWRID